MSKLCPCCSGLLYNACCEPFHLGKAQPKTALELMRSRYCAYALKHPEYIISTTHKANPDFQKDTKAWKQKILESYKTTHFEKLTILDFEEKGDHATVTFTAHLLQGSHNASFTEKSLFEKIKGRWLYKSALSIEPWSLI